MSISLIVNRPDLSSIQLSQPPRSWYALYTSVNQEKLVDERLAQRGIERYLPLYKTVRRRSDRRVSLNLPLFPGYLFVRIHLSEKLRVLEVPRVVRLIGFDSTPLAVSDAEVELLKKGLSTACHVQPCTYLSKGCWVRVLKGPFSGQEGILLKRKQGFRVVLSMHMIMRSFTLEVGEEDVERIPAPENVRAALGNAI